MSEGIVDDTENILGQFQRHLLFCNRIEEGNISKEAQQVEIAKNILDLEELTRRVSILGIFSENEDISEVQTSHISYLILPALLGYLHEALPNPEDRIQSLQLAKAYYRDFFDRLRKYGVISKGMKLDYVIDENEAESCSKDTNDVTVLQKRRDEKIAKFRMQSEISEKLKHFEKLECKSKDEEDARELYLCRLKFWAYKCADALDGLLREVDMLSRFGSLGRDDKTASTSNNPARSQPVKPFIITKNALQKQVYGAGYPSLPVLTVEEWAAEKYKDGGTPQSSAPQNGDGQGDHDSSEDEENIMRKRQEDEYKDVHRRGWGNTKNKG